MATGGEKGRGYIRSAKRLSVLCGSDVVSAQKLEVSLLGVGTVLRLERNALSVVK